MIGQVAYYYKDDTSIRAIPNDTPTARIHFSHITENYLENPRKDPNCIIPLSGRPCVGRGRASAPCLDRRRPGARLNSDRLSRAR